MLKKIASLVFYLTISFLLAITVLSFIRRQPTLIAAVSSWSMEPHLTRGDAVILLPVSKRTGYSVGQIILFRSEENGISKWILHRITGGNAEEGFITKGDNNRETDQEGRGYPLIQREWIAGVVPTVSGIPLKIPFIGYIPLVLQENVNNTTLLTLGLGLTVLVLVVSEIVNPAAKKKKDDLQGAQLYFLGGVIFAFIMATLMLTGSLFVNIPFAVANHEEVFVGSAASVLTKGQTRDLVLIELNNEGLIPIFYYVVSNEPQLDLQKKAFCLQGGGQTEIKATVYAQEPGMYEAAVRVMMFLPFLPPSVIFSLAGISAWLALVAVSLVPAIPLFVFPFLFSHHRRSIKKAWRKKLSFVKMLFS